MGMGGGGGGMMPREITSSSRYGLLCFRSYEIAVSDMENTLSLKPR